MIEFENECVVCHMGCIDCGRKRVARFYCDKCGREDTLYDYTGEQLCKDCLLESAEIVEGSE